MTDPLETTTAERSAAAAEWMRGGEALIAAGVAGEPDIGARIDRLAPPSDPAVRRRVACCALVALVYGHHYELARRFAEDEGLWALADPDDVKQAPRTLTADEVHALFSLTQIDIAEGGDLERALVNFGHLQRLLPPDHQLHRASADGEAHVLRRLGRAVYISWPRADAPGKTILMDCPNCAATAPKSEVCTVNAHFPGRDVVSSLRRCPACTCIFLEAGRVLDYHEDFDLGGSVLAFYIQQAAGIWPITRPLARVSRPAGSRYIDVGCSFGFGLDFALHQLGWRGRGLDPSPLARRGAEQLSLPIEFRYFTPEDTEPPADVVMASEVLEHLAEPRQFIAMLRQALAPGGVLIVTTPNGDAVRRDSPPSILTPVLSLGAHLVLQTAESLEWLLRDAGLAHVVVVRTPISLIAYASDQPLVLENDEARLRDAYRSYLRARISSTSRDTDLWLGFAGRSVHEASVDSDTEAVDATLPLLADELRVRYGIDLDNPATLPPLTGGMSTEQLCAVAPFSIANLLFHRAVQRRRRGEESVRLGDLFLTAAQTARTVRRIVLAMNADDFTIAIVEHEAAAHATLAAARCGSADTLDRLAFALASPDGADQPPLRNLADATLAALLTAGAFRLARRLRAEFPDAAGPRRPRAWRLLRAAGGRLRSRLRSFGARRRQVG